MISGVDEQLRVYEDEKAIVYAAENACGVGHLLVFPKEPYQDLEQCDEETFVHLMYVASFASTAIFEGLGLQGTNIILYSGNDSNNTYDRICIQVLPRTADDGLELQWKPKQNTDLAKVQEDINNYTFFIGKKETTAKPQQVETNPTEQESIEGEENYLLKHLKRLP